MHKHKDYEHSCNYMVMNLFDAYALKLFYKRGSFMIEYESFYFPQLMCFFAVLSFVFGVSNGIHAGILATAIAVTINRPWRRTRSKETYERKAGILCSPV
jgi:hypothetical protein